MRYFDLLKPRRGTVLLSTVCNSERSWFFLPSVDNANRQIRDWRKQGAENFDSALFCSYSVYQINDGYKIAAKIFFLWQCSITEMPLGCQLRIGNRVLRSRVYPGLSLSWGGRAPTTTLTLNAYIFYLDSRYPNLNFASLWTTVEKYISQLLSLQISAIGHCLGAFVKNPFFTFSDSILMEALKGHVKFLKIVCVSPN